MESRKDCATEYSVQNLQSEMNSDFNFVNSHLDSSAVANNASRERINIAQTNQAERLAAHGENVTSENGVEIRSRLAHVDANVEKFGLYNADKTEKFGLSNYGAVKDAEKNILLEGCKDTDEVNDNVSGQAKDIQMQACGDTASIIQNSSLGFRDSLLQAANNTAALQASVAKAMCDIELQAANNTAAIQLQNTLNAKDGQITAVGNAKDAALVATLNAKDAQISAVTNAKDALINANENARSIEKQLCEMAKDQALTAMINAKDAALTAALNAAAIAKQVAECCCEQKSLTIEEGNRTRELIRAEREQDLRDARQREHEELVALRLRSSLCPPPVAAVGL